MSSLEDGNGFTPSPEPSSDDHGADQDSLEILRQRLKEQRAKQRACLERHKKTTFTAVEAAKKGTTYYDAERIKKMLEEEDSAE